MNLINFLGALYSGANFFKSSNKPKKTITICPKSVANESSQTERSTNEVINAFYNCNCFATGVSVSGILFPVPLPNFASIAF